MSLFKKEIDVSDPYFFLFLKRGIIRECIRPPRSATHLTVFTPPRICRSQTDPGNINIDFESHWQIQRW